MGFHAEVNLNAGQREIIMDWAKVQKTYLKDNYHADSLVMPKRRRPVYLQQINHKRNETRDVLNSNELSNLY